MVKFLQQDPRFAPVLTRVLNEAQALQRRVTVQTLRNTCTVTHPRGSVAETESGFTYIRADDETRGATDDEIADPTKFLHEKTAAGLIGIRYATDHVKRWLRYYGLRSKYVPH